MEIALFPDGEEVVIGDFEKAGHLVHLKLKGSRELVEEVRELLTMHLILPVGGKHAKLG